MLSDDEVTYLQSQRLARLATVGPNGQPTVDAVGFEFDGEQFFIGGHNLPASRKYRNIISGSHQVALIVDDLVATDPWTPRGIKIHGVAEIESRTGMFGLGDYFVITRTVAWSWGVLAPTFGEQGPLWHKTVWPATS